MILCRSRRRQVVEMHYCRLFGWAHNPNNVIPISTAKTSGSNKGHESKTLQYLCGFVGRHLHRKVVEFAVSHEAVNRRVVGSSPT
jgi:hypothetical protein